MSELVRTCKKCGGKYTGWHCNSDKCKAAREKRNASARKRRRNRGGGSGRRIHRYAASSFSWGASLAGPVAVCPDACPKTDGE